MKLKESTALPEPKAASKTETARLLGGVSPKTVGRMIADGRLRAVRVGRRVIVPLTEIDRVLEAR